MTVQNYYQIIVKCSQDLAEALVELIENTGAASVSLEDAQDEPLFEPKPDEMPLWSQVKLTALYTDESVAQEALEVLQAKYPFFNFFPIEILADRDWVRETQAQFTSQCFKDLLWLYPAWEEVQTGHTPVVKLAPGLAFGTGTHPTTQMCLNALVEFVHPKDQVIDFGCGSGILGIAALKLGAQKVYAIDIDPQAWEATQNNAALNTIDAQQLWVGDNQSLPSTLKVEVLVANILAKPLIDLNVVFKKLLKPEGKIILAGLLQEQVEVLIAAYQPWVTLEIYAQEEEWVCLVGDYKML